MMKKLKRPVYLFHLQYLNSFKLIVRSSNDVFKAPFTGKERAPTLFSRLVFNFGLLLPTYSSPCFFFQSKKPEEIINIIKIK